MTAPTAGESVALGAEFEELHRLRAQVKELRAENLEYDIQRNEMIAEAEHFAEELRGTYARIAKALESLQKAEHVGRKAHVGPGPIFEALCECIDAANGATAILKDTP